jgi:GntR family transcriptional regulator/MocR family aminotransferase
VLTRPLSKYYATDEYRRHGLLLGYACVSESEIVARFELLLKSLADVARQRA